MKTRSKTIATKRSAARQRRRQGASKGTEGRRATRVVDDRRHAEFQRRQAEFGVPLAVVEGRRVAIANRRFEELKRTNAGASWIRLGSNAREAEGPLRGIGRLLVREVAGLAGAGDRAVTRLYRRVDGDDYLEASYWHFAGRGGSKHAVVMIHDATARVRAEHELERMSEALVQHERMRAIGQLASGVAHDLNNTLHAMNLRLSLIEQNPLCKGAEGDNIAALSRAINDAALVVGRLQDFARPQDRSLDFVHVSAVVAEAIEMVRTTIEGQSSLDGVPVRIRTRLPLLPAVTALASELRHVVVNLLLNARDAMPHGGGIEVVAEGVDDRVVLEVLDDGCGIPDEDLERIFYPFFTTKGIRGTGLGLSNARAVLGRLGGAISARNRAEGGACFTLSFPIASPPTSPLPARRPFSLPAGRRILVVDDDLENLQATKMLMELDGQSVDIAQTGSEVIARLLAGSRYDLVLCDLGMPDMNGWRIAREIQKVAPGTVVYMLTGWAQQIKQDDPDLRWVKGVLQKPMTPELMRDLLAGELAPASLEPNSSPEIMPDPRG